MTAMLPAWVRLTTAVLTTALSTACLMALPADRDARHTEIRWRHDYEAAQRDARRTQKPLLIIGVAGDLTGPC